MNRPLILTAPESSFRDEILPHNKLKMSRIYVKQFQFRGINGKNKTYFLSTDQEQIQSEAGVQIEGDLGEILALKAKILPYIAFREK